MTKRKRKSNKRTETPDSERTLFERDVPDLGSKRTALLLCLILALTAVVYANSFQNAFTNWDDDKNVYENSYISEISLHNLKIYFTKPLVAMYTPLVYLSYAVDYKIERLNPVVYHATNLLLHLINAALLFFAARLITGRMWAAAVTTLLFAVHPLNVAAVTPVSVRSSLLYSMFYLGAFLLYIKYVQSGRYEGKYLAGAGLLFLLSLLSKSAAVVFPFVMILIDYFYGRSMNKRVVLEKIPFFILSLIFGILTIIFREDARHLGSSILFSTLERVFLAAYGILFYVVKLILPINLSSYYPYPQRVGGAYLPWTYYLALPAFALAVFALYRIKEHRKLILFGGLFYLINIALVLKIIPLGNEMVCDRYAYLPTAGLLIAATAIFFREKEKRFTERTNLIKATPIMLVVCVALLSWMSHSRNTVWRDNFSLYHDMITKGVNVPIAYNGRGIAYWQEKSYQKALEDFSQAIAMEPMASEYYNNRGNVRAQLRDYAGAERDLDRAIALIYPAAAAGDAEIRTLSGQLDSDTAYRLAAVYSSRAALREAQQDYGRARADFTNAIACDPEYSRAYYGRASVSVALNELDSALGDYNKAIELDPSRGGSAYYRRAYVYMIRQDYLAALKDYSKALEFNSSDVDALNNRGFVRHALQDESGAIEDYTRAIMLAPDRDDAYYNRGLVRWITNDKEGACADWRRAAELGRKDSREVVMKNCSQEAGR